MQQNFVASVSCTNQMSCRYLRSLPQIPVTQTQSLEYVKSLPSLSDGSVSSAHVRASVHASSTGTSFASDTATGTSFASDTATGLKELTALPPLPSSLVGASVDLRFNASSDLSLAGGNAGDTAKESPVWRTKRKSAPRGQCNAQPNFQPIICILHFIEHFSPLR
jgi:hypothetical protein